MGIKQRNKKEEAGEHRGMNGKASVGSGVGRSGALLCSGAGIYTALGTEPQTEGGKGQRRLRLTRPRRPDITQLVRGMAGSRDQVS